VNSERIVVVTGGAAGIGLGISELFASNGHPLAILDLDRNAAESEAKRLNAAGGNVIGLGVDVADAAAMDAAYAAVRTKLGPIAIVIANAGYSEARPIGSMTRDQWRRMIDVNLHGVFNTIHPALPDMVERQWGRIVTISSQAAQSGAPNRAHYAAAKGGVIALTKALAMELAREGITVNTIPPALVATPMMVRETESGDFPGVEAVAATIPMGRAGTPEDIAFACEFLCSDKASYITGQQINVNGGTRM
jgi:2-hydroxycyclohexanecarboxyl-CoA dehydrogenase